MSDPKTPVLVHNSTKSKPKPDGFDLPMDIGVPSFRKLVLTVNGLWESVGCNSTTIPGMFLEDSTRDRIGGEGIGGEGSVPRKDPPREWISIEESYTIAGEPCHAKAWDLAHETVMEFADRMVRERGWIVIVYELPRPRSGQYPELRIDNESVTWTTCTYVHVHHLGCGCDPTEEISQTVTCVQRAEHHLELMDHFEQEGCLGAAFNGEVRKILLKEIANRP